MAVKPWGGVDPNSQHQLWSRWTVTIYSSDPKRRPGMKEVIENARKYFSIGFKTSVGRVRCEINGPLYKIIIEVEGPPAHDPDYRRAVRKDLDARFVAQGFGPSAWVSNLDVGVLAGDTQDGAPPSQLIVMPHIKVS